MNSRLIFRRKLSLDWLIELLSRLFVYFTPAKYLAYNRSTKVISCKGCLPAFVNGKEVNEFKLFVGSTFTPAPPLPPLLPMYSEASKLYSCKGRPGFLAIHKLTPDDLQMEVKNHCSLSREAAHFTLLIIYQVVGETDLKRHFYFFSEAVNCQGKRVWWRPYSWTSNQEVDPSGKPVTK
jgi:hypothetical protein